MTRRLIYIILYSAPYKGVMDIDNAEERLQDLSESVLDLCLAKHENDREKAAGIWEHVEAILNELSSADMHISITLGKKLVLKDRNIQIHRDIFKKSFGPKYHVDIYIEIVQDSMNPILRKGDILITTSECGYDHDDDEDENEETDVPPGAEVEVMDEDENKKLLRELGLEHLL